MQITVDLRGLDEVQAKLRRLPGELQDRAAALAINKTAAKANTELTRAIVSEFAIDRASVRNSVQIGRASAKRAGQVTATIDIFGSSRRRGRSLNVAHFLEKSITLAEGRRRIKRCTLFVQGKGGRLLPVLGFRFKKGGGVKHIEGAFIGNKGRTVFVRTGDARLPIKPVQMIGVSQMFGTGHIKRRVMDRIDRELVVETERAVKLTMARLGL